LVKKVSRDIVALNLVLGQHAFNRIFYTTDNASMGSLLAMHMIINVSFHSLMVQQIILVRVVSVADTTSVAAIPMLSKQLLGLLLTSFPIPCCDSLLLMPFPCCASLLLTPFPCCDSLL